MSEPAMSALERLRMELGLEPPLLMLLANTGSMTALLEAVFGGIRVVTESQRIVDATPGVARTLSISPGEKVNHRVVRLVGERVLVRATSYAPLSRLESRFKNDVMRTDLPIGKILAKHNLESRREILGYGWLSASREQALIFGVEEGAVLLRRSYNIIHNGRALLNITEVFPRELARWLG